MKKYTIIAVALTCFIGAWTVFRYISAPMVSVVMSTYNRADLLPRAVESILNQTYGDFEFIIIDDGSTDGTVDILRAYTEQDNRIKVITNRPNQGLIVSLNKGIDAARGKYIARMDDDDVAVPQRFERQVAFMEDHSDVAAVGSWISPLDSMTPYSFQRETDPERIRIMLYLGSVPVCHPSLLMRRDFLNRHHIRYRQGYEAAEDRPFYGEIISAGGQIANIPEVLMHYRLHGSNNPEYYRRQAVNKRRFHIAFINRFFSFDVSEPFRKCDLLPRMLKANTEKHLVDQDTLARVYQDLCGSMDTDYLKETEQ